MKQQNIIQRLCLFLFAFLLVAPACGETFTENVSDFSEISSKKKDMGTRTSSDGVLTVTWSDTKYYYNVVGGFYKIIEMAAGGTVTISCKAGWRIRSFKVSDSNYPLNTGNIKCSSDADLYSGSGDISSYDAPRQSITLTNTGTEVVKFQKYTIEYVKDPGISFSQTTYDPCLGETMDLSTYLSNPNNLSVSYAVNNANIASISNNVLTTKGIGKGTLTATYNADANYAKGTATATIDIYRRDLNPSLAWTSKNMKAWETISMPTLQDMPSDYRPTWNQCTYSSSDESTVKPAGNRNELIFGGSGYGKTATITITIPQTNKYNEKKLTYTVTVDNEMRIGSKADWQAFADQVNGGNQSINATMTADVDLGTDYIIIGRKSSTAEKRPFEGTFDGAGHTLSINWEVDKEGAAPFYGTHGASFKNLRVKGKITNHDYTTGGFVGNASGNLTFTNCISEVDISSSANNSNQVWAAGFIGNTLSNRATISFKDCAVTGTITGVNSQDVVSGFCNLSVIQLNVNFENCLFAGSTNGNANSAEFCYPKSSYSIITLTNCYYLNRVNGGADAQGTQVTADQLKSGEVTYKLQSDREYTVWGQTLGTDNLPQLFKNTSCYVYKVSFKKDGETKATRYATYNNPIYGSLPTAQDFLGEAYNAHHYYTLAFADGFNESTAVRLDKDVAVTITNNEYFEIASANDWKAFCDLVNGGQTALNGKLTKDIDLGSNIWMIGSREHRYGGTFDGQGKTLAINWVGNGWSDSRWSPFQVIEGATIRNLKTWGTISGWKSFSGIVNDAYGSNSIQRCFSAVNIHATGNSAGDSESAGILTWSEDPANVTISDCIVTGNFSGGSGHWSGITKASNYVKNCLYIGTIENAGTRCTTFGYWPERVSNCYYLNPCGEVQGTQVTEKQLKNGEVAKLLQAGRTDQCYWAQKLGETPIPFDGNTLTTNKIFWNVDSQRWECALFYATDYLPVGMDFYASSNIPRTITRDTPYTLALPYEWSNTDDQIYVLSSFNKEKGIVGFRQVENSENGTPSNFEAYKPYLVIPKYNRSAFYSSAPRLFKAEPDTPVAENVNGVQWCATYAGMSNAEAAAAGAYILQSDGMFHKVTAENSAAVIPPYRAYITLPANAPAPARAMSISFGDETTTGLRAIETTDRDGTVRYYDMQGRYIGTTLDGQPQGIYVKDGKKVMKK